MRRIRQNYLVECFYGYAMILPALLFILVFLFYPIIHSIFLSLQKTDWFNSYTFIGLENFRSLLESEDFWITVKNTVLFTIISVPVIVALSTVFAVLLNSKIKGMPLFRICFLLPVVTISVASTLVWKWIFNGDFGILNELVKLLGFQPVYWISDERTAMISLLVMVVWGSLGNNIIILIAGMQGIPKVYYEAAKLDGASSVDTFRKITLPLLSPTLFFIIVTSLIRMLQIFDAPYMLIGSAKGFMYPLVGTVIYEYFFVSHDIGYGSAIVVMLFLWILLITAVQFALEKFWVNYD